ncbi:type II toxin-antitoxin system VapC family toxin [Endozoicomonas sp. ALB032]|uniref:type II toxin-antitoxin system VapC family toxin n=1 Tax=Endozoicomonas sp. ALB032 TaxID=3403082 RepID=UPI003BB600F1
MSVVYLDSCVVIDVLDTKAPHYEWAVSALEQYAELSISPIAFSEICAPLRTVEEALSLLKDLNLTLRAPCHRTLFLASKKHLEYRRRSGKKSGVLSDFFIGAQAAVEKGRLITRNKGRFSTYFPMLDILCP